MFARILKSNFLYCRTEGGFLVILLFPIMTGPELQLRYKHVETRGCKVIADVRSYTYSVLSFSRIYYRLKFQKRLTNAALNSVLGLVMESIDFNGVYVTENTLKLLCRRCPKLRSLEMKGCGYVMTDRLLDTLLKVSKILAYALF